MYNHAPSRITTSPAGSRSGRSRRAWPNMERIVELNRGPLVAAQPPLQQVADAGDAVVLDVRPARDFADGHLPGAVNVPVSGSSFATKHRPCFLERPVVIHAADEADAGRERRRCAARGRDLSIDRRLAAGRRRRARRLSDDRRVLGQERLLVSGETEVLDVREANERDAGFIPGTDHMPYRNVRQAAENGLCGERPIVTICESGARAAVAASVLRAAGLDARPVLGSGIADWRARGGEVASFRRCGSRQGRRPADGASCRHGPLVRTAGHRRRAP